MFYYGTGSGGYSYEQTDAKTESWGGSGKIATVPACKSTSGVYSANTARIRVSRHGYFGTHLRTQQPDMVQQKKISICLCGKETRGKSTSVLSDIRRRFCGRKLRSRVVSGSSSYQKGRSTCSERKEPLFIEDFEFKTYFDRSLRLTAFAVVQAYYFVLLLFLHSVRFGNSCLEAAMATPFEAAVVTPLPGANSSSTSSTVSSQNASTPQSTMTAVVPGPGVRYLPMSMGAEMPFFTGANITEFLERYEAQCEDYGIQGNAKLAKLPQFCEITVGMYIRTILEWREKDWEGLKKVLLEEYRQTDSYQQMMTLGFLNALQEKGCTDGTTVRVYCRQYDHVSSTLLKKGVLSPYSQSVGFLKGLPKAIRDKVVRKHSIDLDVPDTMEFKELLKTVQKQHVAERTNEVLAEKLEHREAWSEIVDQVQAKVTVPKGERLAPPVRTIHESSRASSSTQQTSLDRKMEELTREMSALVLAQRVALQASTSVSNSNVRMGRPQGQVQNDVVPAASVNTQRPAFSGCYYCGEEHQERECLRKKDDISQGLIHLNESWKICLGKAPSPGQPAAQPIFVRFGEPKRSQVMALIGQQSTSTDNRTKVGSIRIGDSGDYSDDDAVLEQNGDILAYSDESSGEDTVWVKAARVKDNSKSTTSRKFPKDVHRVLKNKVEKEKKMPAAKHVRPGTWKPVQITEVLDDEQDIEMIEPEPSKSVRFQLSKSQEPTRSLITHRPKLVDELKSSAQPEVMLNKILDQPVSGVTTREILANSPNLLRMVFKYLDSPGTKPPKSEEPAVTRVGSLGVRKRTEELFYSVATPKIKVRINEECLVQAMVDSGAEVSVMTRDIAEDAKLPITPSPDLTLIAHGGEKKWFAGVCENTPIQIGGITIYAHIFVVEDADIPLILGMPFIFDSRLSLVREGNAQYAVIPDPDTNKALRVRVLQEDDVANRVQDQIFPKN